MHAVVVVHRHVVEDEFRRYRWRRLPIEAPDVPFSNSADPNHRNYPLAPGTPSIGVFDRVADGAPGGEAGPTKRRIGAVRDRLGAPRVLDVGCRTGEFAGLFDPARYQGIDLSERYVGFARRTYPAYRFACADAGHFIRTPVAWHALVSAVTAIDRTDAYVSGACAYFLMECRVR